MKAAVHRSFTRLILLVVIAGWPAVARAQHLDVLHAFAGTNAGFSRAAVIQGSDGRFYRSMCPADATASTVFVVTDSGDATLLHEFDGNTEGTCPNALVHARDGNLYGTTQSGGTNAAGTIFRLSLTGALTVLHTFSGGVDGGAPLSGLIEAPEGTLYGTTSSGGTANLGTAYTYTPGAGHLVLHSFAGGALDGAFPSTALVHGTDGNFYGTTGGGGDINRGVVFRMTASGSVTVLHAFTGSRDDGSSPSGIVEALDGNFYGVTTYGRILGAPLTTFTCPLYFRISAAGAFERLRVPEQCSPATVFQFNLTVGRTGQLLGTTDSFGGSFVFSLGTDGRFTFLQRLLADTEGGFLVSPLAAAPDGHFYGTTSAGGSGRGGTFFRLRVVPDAPSDVAVTSVQGQVRLSWAPAAGATSYTIRRREAGAAPSIVATAVAAVSFVDAAVTRHRHYYYLVSAVNEYGETLASYEVSIRAGRATGNDFDGDGRADIAVSRGGGGDLWFIRGSAMATSTMLVLAGLPCPGDYDGDGIADFAVVRQSTGTWFIRLSSSQSAITVQPGMTGRPVPADYDGDGKADVAVYRESDGTWHILRSSVQSWSVVTWGGMLNDRPAPADYDGDGRVDIAIFRPATGTWFVRRSATGDADAIKWGIPSDTPTPGDYDGDGRTDVAIYRGASGTWYIRESSTAAAVSWYSPGHRPVPGDYDGDGRTDVASFTQESNGDSWVIQSSAAGTSSRLMWGGGADIPVPGDYDGDRRTDVAVFRPPSGTWHIKLSATNDAAAVAWGWDGDLPAPGDYDGDGTTDIAIFRPSNGTWYIRESRTSTSTAMVWGTAGDIPVPADYDGDGLADVAVFRPTTGEWHIRLSATQAPLSGSWGTAGDIPVNGDYDGDGRSDVAVFRPSSGAWHIAGTAGPTPALAWGGPFDLPIPSEPVTLVP